MGTYNPVSTYRLQFNGDFTLSDAAEILSYLKKTGIRTIYASPVFSAVSGSTHGYDVTDPLSLNPEIGSAEEFDNLVRRIHMEGMGWLQDFVPNHMAYSTENPWIYDILVHGRDSPRHHFFDIITDHPDPELRERLILPFFGKPAGLLVRDGELELRFVEGGFILQYFDQAFPVSRRAAPSILKAGMDVPGARITAEKQIPETVRELLSGTVSPDDWEASMKQLSRDYDADPDTARYIDRCLELVKGDHNRMKQLLVKLTWLPVHWKETEKRINYRRFFTINGLICLNMQLADVFEHTHGLVGSWITRGLIDGLRIDHIDGLYDPTDYLERLRGLCGEKAYLVVEKILEKDEKLPESWPVQGTTGYDFLAMVNNLLTRSSSGRFFHDYYAEWTGRQAEDPARVFLEKKRFILHHRLQGDLELLTHECLAAGIFESEKFGWNTIREAIAGFIIHCPVYKYYRVPSDFGNGERQSVKEIFSEAARSGRADKKALKVLEHAFMGRAGQGAGKAEATEQTARVDRFFRRLMQFTGPLMAKGLEDTAYYTFNPFIAHNEVGDSPGFFGIGQDDFHRFMILRQKDFPTTLNTLSSHDTKRGEDARARLNSISDIPGQWKKATGRWRRMNRRLKTISEDGEIPSPADEYLIYQALCAHLPMDGKADMEFMIRLEGYLVKALREGKERSSWSEPDEDYEEKTLSFCRSILAPGHPFLNSLHRFLEPVIPHGIINSVAQVILRNTVPGVPDTFQGSETWNFSFVDPDNRSPVDYETLSGDLDRMIRAWSADRGSAMKMFWKEQHNGRIKQWATYLTLQERVNDPELFLKGAYTPLKVTGRYREHLIAYCRSYRDRHLVVILPLNTAALPRDHHWENTFIKLPALLPEKWENRFTGEVRESNGALKAGEILEKIPFAVLGGIANQPEKRAGILMHVSSLPGDFGTGDFGPGAYHFVDFLQQSGQRWWQILPLSAVSARAHYSPYSSRSAFAGNILFIDPYQMEEAGLLDPGEAGKFRLSSGDSADYAKADRIKSTLLDRAYGRFRTGGMDSLRKKFNEFMEKEHYWIGDYSLYEVLKRRFSGSPWHEWPAGFRDRDRKTMNRIRREQREELEKVCFGQFLFACHWEQLRRYARDRGVDIFGDLPIYIDHDSADTWAHPRLFRLSADRSMEAVAGVPPDYFNSEGQLWGMPLYDWKKMKSDGYRWWLHRIGRNLQWYDLLRLDHFRGFSAYWEVPSGDPTAKNGRWIPGPGTALFDAIREYFPDMPFVAEDLGQIDQPVYDLRDQYRLPGMKVVQFGFGSHMAFSHHSPGNIPYHCIVYTGTHDNNTMVGWFRKEADKKTLRRFRSWTGKRLKEKNVHNEMIRVSFASPARLVIVPMQDWLGLDEKSRMNYPSTTGDNWLWRVDPGMLKKKVARRIRKKVILFGRY